MGTVEIVIALLGLLERAPEIGESVERIFAAMRQKGELTEAQWLEAKARRQAEQQQDHWKP
jgi:hypothetical protein